MESVVRIGWDRASAGPHGIATTAKSFSKEPFVSLGLRSGAKGGLALREAFVQTEVVLLDKFAT